MPWKYIDTLGRDVFGQSFDRARPFHNHLAAVRFGSTWRVIDRSGSFAFSHTFEAVGNFSLTYTYAKVNGLYGFIDHSGEFLIPPKFEIVPSAFSCGLSSVDINGLTGYIDTSGEFVIPPRFRFAESFSEGFAVICDPEDYFKKWFIDQRGEYVFGPFQSANSFAEGVAAVNENDLCRFIDRKGNTVLSLPEGVHAHYFQERAAATQFAEPGDGPTANVTYGYIDRAGKVVIPPTFDLAHAFRNGTACVKVGDGRGLIARDGAWIVDPVYSDIEEMWDERIRVIENDRVGFLDEHGYEVIEPQFKTGFSFTEGLASVCTD